MCGAYSLTNDPENIIERFSLKKSPDFKLPKQTVARPSQKMPIITNKIPDQLTEAIWGFQPEWSKSPIFNTRLESLEKPFYKNIFHQNRCLIPASSFFEWHQSAGKKIPYRFLFDHGKLFSFAGIWKEDSTTGQIHFSILTMPPNQTIAKLHDRMPIILLPENESDWLNSAQPKQALQPIANNLLEAQPISSILL
jgi:putative SOS response-associated peptidase YedK